MRKTKFISMLFLAAAISSTSAQTVLNMEFRNQDIKDILLVLAKESGKSISADPNINGKTTIFFCGITAEEAVGKIIDQCSLKSEEKNGVLYISLDERKIKEKNRKQFIKKNGDFYSIDAERVSFKSIAEELLTKAEKEHSLFVTKDVEIRDLHFDDKTFDELFEIILAHGHADYTIKNNMYFITESESKDVMHRFRETRMIELKNISGQQFINLVPQSISKQTVLKTDKNAGHVTATGMTCDLDALEEFAKKTDVVHENKKTKSFALKYMDSKTAISLIPADMLQCEAREISGRNEIILTGSEESIKRTEAFLESIDRINESHPIRLHYMKTSELMKNLPPSVKKEELLESSYPNLLFYKGSEEGKKRFLEELELIDRPKPQIKYQLLIVQYKKNDSEVFKPSLKISKTSDSENFVFGAEMSAIMALSFDVVSSFGYQAAQILNSQISQNKANIFTDTTLQGISGEEIKFQNTDTYRYIEYEYDKNNGTSAAGVTQQITSGLIVNLNGWISGDNMITMNVNATISKQNGENSSSSASSTVLPSTSERVVSTQIRTASGEPVVISGLIKEDENISESRIPVLSSIPFIGKLFTHKTESKEKTEIVLYIVPHLIEETEEDDRKLTEHWYRKFIAEKKE